MKGSSGKEKRLTFLCASVEMHLKQRQRQRELVGDIYIEGETYSYRVT